MCQSKETKHLLSLASAASSLRLDHLKCWVLRLSSKSKLLFTKMLNRFDAEALLLLPFRSVENLTVLKSPIRIHGSLCFCRSHVSSEKQLFLSACSWGPYTFITIHVNPDVLHVNRVVMEYQHWLRGCPSTMVGSQHVRRPPDEPSASFAFHLLKCMP